MRTSLLCVAFGLELAAAGVARAQSTTRVSVDSSGAQGNGDSLACAASADGQIIAFVSLASNLVSGDTNGFNDVFVHDRRTGITERVTVDSAGTEGNGDSYDYGPAISADGRFVAFPSEASNLVSGDTNGGSDVFVHDRQTGTTERVSVDSVGTEGNDRSYSASISADGRVVAFFSQASNLISGDTNGRRDVFVHDRQTGTTERVSVDSAGLQANYDSDYPSITADGQVVAFHSTASNLVPGDTNSKDDVFVHDRQTGVTERVSINSAGKQGFGVSGGASITADGQIVAFESLANLVSGDSNHFFDVYVRDRKAGTTERVSIDSSGTQGNGDSGGASISADGQVVAFWSDATNLVSGDTNGFLDVFSHDRKSGTTERVSIDSSGTEGNGRCGWPSISADSGVVAFFSEATNLVPADTNGFNDTFVHEFNSTPASWSNYGSGYPGTNGVPSFTSQQNPVIGTTITLDLGNSYGQPTAGLLFIGFQQANIHSSWGGDLLVVPTIVMPVSFSYGGDSFTGDLPDDWRLCGLAVDLQAIEGDPGAAKGVSFTQGLQLILGR